MYRTLFVIVSISVGMVLGGCSRKASENTSIRLSFGSSSSSQKASSAKTLAAASVNVIIINVSGPGISPPIFYQWQGSHNSSVVATPPESIDLTVPKGDGRLIQALVVMNPVEGESGMVFQYGDQVASLSGDVTAVSITTAALGSAGVGDAQIAGRYLTAPNVGPTGKINIYYQIPGKPRMLVDNHSEMFAGWFRIFAIEGGQLEYGLDDGTTLFGGPISVDSTQLLMTGAESIRAMRLLVPPYYYTRGPSGPRVLSGASRSIFGYFGPYASGKQICYKSASAAVPYSYVDALTSTTLQWNPLTGSPVAADIYIQTVNGVKGGVSSTTTDATGLCTVSGLSRFTDFISVNEMQVTSHDQVIGFNGPFQVQTSGGGRNVLTTSIAGTTLTVSWKFLPGVQVPSTAAVRGVDGVDLYGRIEASGGGNNENYRANDGVNCSGISNFGFRFLHNQVSNVDPSVLPVTATVTSLGTDLVSAYSAGLTTIVACPYSSVGGEKQYFSAAAVAYPSAGSQSNYVQANTLEIVGPQSPDPVTVITYTCTPIQLLAKNGTQPAYFTSGQTVNLTPDGGMTLWRSPDCTSQAVSGAFGVSGASDKLYVKISDLGAHSLTATAPGLAIVGPLPITSVSSPGTLIPVLRTQSPTSLFAYQCVKLDYQGWHDYPNAGSSMAELTSSPSFAMPSTNYQFFDGSMGPCLGSTLSTFSFTTGMTEKTLYFRYTGSATSISVQPTSATGYSGTYVGGNNISVAQPGPVSTLSLSIPISVTEGNCTSAEVSLRDANGDLTASASSTTVNLATNSGSFYSTSNCSTTITSKVISASTPNALVYFKSTTPGAAILTVSMSTPAASVAQAITVTAATAMYFKPALPGQTFTNGSGVTGTPLPVGYSSVVNVVIYALKYDYTLDTGYNSGLSALTGNSFAVPAYTGVVFTNGVVSFNITAPPSGSSGSIEGYAPTGTGSAYWFSNSASLVPVANQYKIYSYNLTALNPSACQVVMIVPENADGAAMLPSPTVNVTLAVTGGTLYINPTCTNAAGSTFTASQGTLSYIFYYKGNASTSGTITTTPGGATIAAATSASGSVTAPSSWKLIGRTDATGGTPANRCNPYTIFLVDGLGMSVTGTSNGVLHVQMSSLGGTTGAFYSNPNCTGLLDTPSNNYVTFTTVGVATVYASGPASASASQAMNVTGSPYTTTGPALTAY